LQTALGRAFTATQGFSAPATAAAYTRAHALCRRITDPVQRFIVLRGVFSMHNVRAEHQAASAVAEEMLTIAQHTQESPLLAAAHYMLGTHAYWRGAFAAARTHLEAGMACYRPQQPLTAVLRTGHDVEVGCLVRTAEILWLLGFADRAAERVQAALHLAHTLSHPFTLAFALSNVLQVYQCRREVVAVQQWAETLLALAEEHGFQQWQAGALCLRGWSRAMQGHGAEGRAQMEHGREAYRGTGAQVWQPHLLALLAEAHEKAGHVAAGLQTLTEALVLVEQNQERNYEAEIYRLKGELLLHQTSPDEHHAETCFQHAVDIARNQQAKSWELRAATSLARLWQSRGRCQEASDLLAPVYNWFTEGFDTADLQEAKALLNEVS
jgi:predicted ATPase